MVPPTPAKDSGGGPTRIRTDAPQSTCAPHTTFNGHVRHEAPTTALQDVALSEPRRKLAARVVSALCIAIYSLITEAIIDMCSVPLGLSLLSCVPFAGRPFVAASFSMVLVMSSIYAWMNFVLSFLRLFAPLFIAVCCVQCRVDLLHRLHDAYCTEEVGAWNRPSVIRAALLEVLKAIGLALFFFAFRSSAESDTVPILTPGQAFLSALVGKATIGVVLVWLISQGRLARDMEDCESGLDGRDELSDGDD
ncbi:hypothetical protein OH76DRAFT_666457 [Lentinus brumalis]|uniref:Uncharacterized protein n=1 Tax=Lentinus brumalis TaxID=2498619 RepID=A0A371D704_9APHY|nr:hypothetical protein OH76DRAFT_666457 [Polyporus brumalis]